MCTTVFYPANMLVSQVLDEVKNMHKYVQEALLLLANENKNEEKIPPPTENRANLHWGPRLPIKESFNVIYDVYLVI